MPAPKVRLNSPGAISTDKLATFAEILTDGLVIIAADGQILDVNDYFTQMTGWTMKNLVGIKPPFKFWPRSNRSRILKTLLARPGAVNRGRIFEQRLKSVQKVSLRQKDGRPVSALLVSAGVIRNKQGKPIACWLIFRDTTGREHKEETVQDSEEKYRLLVENVNDGIVISQNDKFIFFNRRFAEMLDYQPEELAMKDYREVYTPKSIEILMERKRRRDRGEQVPARYETVFRKKDRSEINVEANVTIINYRDKPATFAVIRDITERKQAEQVLQESEKRFRELFENSPDAVFVEDLNGNVLDVNHAACRLYSMEHEDLVGKNVLELVPPDKRQEVARDFPKLAKGEWDLVEGFSWTKDGRAVPVEIRGSRIDYGGKPALLLHVRDITERKKAEETLKREKEQAEGYLSIAGVMLAIVDADENITLINKKGCEILGYNKGELIGRNWFDILVPKRIRSEVRTVFRKLMAGDIGPVKYYENPVLTKDGRERLISFHNKVIRDPNGQIVGALTSGEDITERKEMEEERAAFTRLALRLAETASLAELGKVVQEEVENLLDYDAFYFSHRRTGEDVFRQLYATDIVNGEKKTVEITDQTVEDYRPLEELLQGEPILINRSGEEYGPALTRFGNKSHPSASLLFAPVRIHDLTIGIISAQSYTPYRYGTSDLALLQRVANIIAPALERAKAEEAQRESEERYQRLFEMASDGIFVIDAAGRFVDVNEAGCLMFGYSRKEFLASDRSLLHFPEDTTLPRQIDRMDWRTGAHLPQIRLRHKDNSEVWVEMSITSFETRGQKFQLRIMRDITERRRTEQALRESEQRYRTLVETATEGISVWDEKGEIVFVNQAELKMFGFKYPADLLGQSVYSFIAQSDHSKIKELVKVTISKGQAVAGLTFRARHVSGRQLFIETNASRINIGGKSYILSFHRHIT